MPRRLARAGLAGALALALLVPPALAAAPPKAAQSGKAFVGRWVTAVRTGDCRTLADIYYFDPASASSCADWKTKLAGLKVLGQQQLGTGLVVRYSAPAINAGKPVEDTFYVERALKGGWSDTSTITGFYAWATNSIRTKAAHVKAFDREAALYVSILRRKDCNGLAKHELTPPGTSKAQQCRNSFEKTLVAALRAHPKAKPVRLGANRSWAFYGVSLGKRFVTIPEVWDSRQGDVDVLTWFNSR